MFIKVKSAGDLNVISFLMSASRTCINPTDHRCGDGRCIEYGGMCDGDRDCQDGSDEDTEMCGEEQTDVHAED